MERLFLTLFFHHFTPVSNHIKQYVFNKCGITKYKHLKNKNTHVNVHVHTYPSPGSEI